MELEETKEQAGALESRSAGYVELLRRNRDFRLLWLGQVVSQLGDWFDTIALFTLVLRLTGSGRAVGLVLVARFLPSVVLGPLSGVFASGTFFSGRPPVSGAAGRAAPPVAAACAQQETGAAFEPYNDIAPLPRDDPHGLRSWYAQLIALRHTYPALRSSHLEFVETGSASNVLAYIRRAPPGGDDLLVLLNYADEPATMSLPAEFRGQALRDLAAGDVLPGADDIALPADGVRVLQRE